MNENVGIPKIPQERNTVSVVNPPISGTIGQKRIKTEPRNLFEMFYTLIGNGVKALPQLLPKVILPVLIFSIINLIIMVIPTYSARGIFKVILFTLVILTASYNNFIARTIFWTIIVTLGKKLFKNIQKNGSKNIISDLKRCGSNLLRSWSSFNGGIYYLVLGAGLGLIFGNFLSRNNKFDKIGVGFVLALTIVGALSKDTNGMTLFVKLFYKDVNSIMGRKVILSEEKAFVIVFGFALGLVDIVMFTVLNSSNGGYIIGTFLLALSLTFMLFLKKGDDIH